jgi:protein-S-isoprenylcysteine O-methyltransferase Ste14
MRDPSTEGRVLPLVMLLAFVALGIGWRSWLHWRRYGSTGFALFAGGSRLSRARNALLLPFALLLFAQAVAALVSPALIVPIDARALGAGWQTAGAVVCGAGLALMLGAQLRLGASWRIGIDEAARPGLVTVGMYRWSRNPIYAWWMVWMVGYVLLLPTWLSILGVLAWASGMRVAVRDEERYLLATYGDEYRAYANRVGRFVPGLGLWRVPTSSLRAE